MYCLILQRFADDVNVDNQERARPCRCLSLISAIRKGQYELVRSSSSSSSKSALSLFKVQTNDTFKIVSLTLKRRFYGLNGVWFSVICEQCLLPYKTQYVEILCIVVRNGYKVYNMIVKKKPVLFSTLSN